MFYVLSCVFVCIMCFGVYYVWAKLPEIKLDDDDDDDDDGSTDFAFIT